MKQPELGRKISELRKAKGLTQEELVERCNISVRTIQRIESGEVTPRTYTVKTILSAMDFDISTIHDEVDKNGIAGWVKKLLLIDIDFSQPDHYTRDQLTVAWIAGIIYFVLGFLKAAAEHFRYEELRMIYSNAFYIILNLVLLVSMILMLRGFIVLGSVYRNYLLRIVTYLLIFGNILTIGYDIASIRYNIVERVYMLSVEALTFGGIGIIFGMALYRLRTELGDAAKYAGVFEVIAGIFLITVVLGFVGLIIQIPAELLEIVVLYKGSELAKNQIINNNLETV